VEAARTSFELDRAAPRGVGPGALPCAFPIRCSGLGEANPRRAPAASKTERLQNRLVFSCRSESVRFRGFLAADLDSIADRGIRLRGRSHLHLDGPQEIKTARIAL
jgi:hypothetical protein